jgi:hypothetical protein
VTLDTKVLADPTDDPALMMKSKPVNTPTKDPSDVTLTLERDKLNPHEVKINDSGKPRIEKTNELYRTKEQYQKIVPNKKDGAEEKKDTEKNESEEKKPAQQ